MAADSAPERSHEGNAAGECPQLSGLRVHRKYLIRHRRRDASLVVSYTCSWIVRY